MPALRAERPALALAASFAPRAEREAIAALLLLWMELRRAGLATERLLTATRIAWWRDALRNRDVKGVPLAESLITLGMADGLAEAIEPMVEGLLETERPLSPHAGVAGTLAASIGGKAKEAEALLVQLDEALQGKAAEPRKFGHPTLDLIQWCCRRPSRLEYPDRHPLLALQMLWASIRL